MATPTLRWPTLLAGTSSRMATPTLRREATRTKSPPDGYVNSTVLKWWGCGRSPPTLGLRGDFVPPATQYLRGGYAPPQDGSANPAVANFVGRDFVLDGYANPAMGGYADEVPVGWLRQPSHPSMATRTKSPHSSSRFPRPSSEPARVVLCNQSHIPFHHLRKKE